MGPGVFFMKKVVIVYLTAILAANLTAQDFAELVRKDPSLAAGNLCPYEYIETALTPVPKGFHPVYVSHYGRHGSRYLSDSKDVDSVLPVIAAADSLGLLSQTGKDLYRDLRTVIAEMDGMYGMLTSRGAREHFGIGSRLAGRFPEVFDDNARIRAVSSIYPRCLLSMANMVMGINSETDDVKVDFITGDRYFAEYIYHRPEDVESPKKGVDAMHYEHRSRVSEPDVMTGHLFNDREKALALIRDPHEFEFSLYRLCSIGHLTDSGIVLLKYFPYDQLMVNFLVNNSRFYYRYAVTEQFKEYQTAVASPLLKDFVSKADEVLESGYYAADLRFGHDTALLPLVTLIEIEGMENCLPYEEVYTSWNISTQICMGSNLQMIFYRNKSGKILVKFMYNEKETMLPALEAVSGPYYDWPAVRKHFLTLCGE